MSKNGGEVDMDKLFERFMIMVGKGIFAEA